MNELKILQRKFASVATSFDDGSSTRSSSCLPSLETWMACAEKVRIFGQPPPCFGNGISVRQIPTKNPSLKFMFEDHVASMRTQGMMVVCPPSVSLKPSSVELSEYAAKKNMGISYVFYAYSNPPGQFPSVFGLAPNVVKILSKETPEDVMFIDREWQEWLFKWITRYMQQNRRFDATSFLVIANTQAETQEDISETVAESIYNAVPEEKEPIKNKPNAKKRGWFSKK